MPAVLDSTIAHYKITAKLGQGGMGEVYRATDSKLDREVAIKVLPEEFAQHPERLARFEREAKALAKLNHPNIGSIYGFDQHEGLWFLVLELIEGEDLSERLKRGPLAVEEALKVFQQIAAALEAAHEKGIIHRDLKPGNIKVDSQGRVKVLDFGLAKARLSSSESVDSSASTADSMAPTITSEFTLPGKVMGTAAYMSPEQSRGQEVDKRTDVWAFGCCLYEALTGRRPFKGATTSDLLADILKSDPDFTVIPPETPSEVLTLLRRCLEKEPRRRLRDLGDIAITLEETSNPSRTGVYSVPPKTGLDTAGQPDKSRRNWAWPVVTALSAALVVAGFFLWRGGKTTAAASNIRSLAVLPFAFETQDPKLSGLGKWIPADIRTKLGPLQNLEVVNLPARIEQLVEQKKSEVEIARALGVDGLVMGELHGQGETMSAYVSVVDGATGRALGKQREIASSASKVFELPNLVALAIVDELKLQVSASQRAEIQVADTQSAEAFLAWQKGVDLAGRRLFDQAAVEFRRAYQLDTNYTRAWTTLAGTEWAPFIFGGTTNEMAATFKRLSGEAERFGARRPEDQAVASQRMWIALLYERDWNKVSAKFWDIQRNQKPDPGILHVMSWYYTFIEGHPELALNAREQVIAMTPAALLFQIDRAIQLAFLGRYDDAVSAYRSLPPDQIQLEDYSIALLMAGDLAGAKEVATRVLAGRPNAASQCNLAAIHARLGAADEARKVLAELEAQAEKGMHIPYAQIAWSYGMLGEFESARRWLRQGVVEGHGDWSMLTLRSAEKLEVFGKLKWSWEIIDEMKFPPLQMDHPYFALEQAMRYGRGTVGPSTTSTSINEPPKTLAVLPFANTSADKSDDSFSDGITEDLITSLQKVRGLRVQGRMSSFYFKGKNETPQRVGEQLKVEHLLNGSVSRDGSRLRISADLVTAASGFSLWSTNYDRQLDDTFAIRTEVAQEVAQALKVQLGVEETRSLVKRPTESLAAYQHYLQALTEWNKFTKDGFENCIRLANEALLDDARFAAAWELTGRAHTASASMGYVRPKEAWPAAEAALDKALALDGQLAEAHASRGAVAMFARHDWETARRELETAMQLNPSYSDAHELYSFYLVAMGRLPEALAAATRDQELDPLRPNAAAHVGNCNIYLGRYDRAIEEGRKALQRAPDFPNLRVMLATAYVAQGNAAEGIAVMKQMNGLEANPFALSVLGYAYGEAGEKAEGARVIEKLKRLEQAGQYVAPTCWARVYLGLGETNRAIEWLERIPDEPDGFVPYLKVQPQFARLRSEPRFVELLKKLGMDK